MEKLKRMETTEVINFGPLNDHLQTPPPLSALNTSTQNVEKGEYDDHRPRPGGISGFDPSDGGALPSRQARRVALLCQPSSIHVSLFLSVGSRPTMDTSKAREEHGRDAVVGDQAFRVQIRQTPSRLFVRVHRIVD